MLTPLSQSGPFKALQSQVSQLAITVAGLTAGAPINSPVFTGNPQAPTPATNDNSTSIATTAYVQSNLSNYVTTASLTGYALLASPAFTGTPTAPTPLTADSTTKLATTAYVQANLASYATTASLSGYALLASPAFSGTPTAPTAGTATNTTQVATTAFVKAQGYAALASPALTGTPTAPTAGTADNSTTVATTAFVKAQAYAPLASPALTGTPTAPTATAGTNTTQLATTAFVAAGFAPLTGAWTAYTPTISAGSGSFTTVAATGRWLQVGKTIFVFVQITITTNGTAASSVNFTLPIASKNTSVLVGTEGAVTGKLVQARLPASGSTAGAFFYDNTYPGASGAILNISGSYETT